MVAARSFDISMEIQCPSCEADNTVEFGENITCSECDKSFAGHYYKKFKKPLVSATAALFIGALGAYKVDQIFFEDQRYPSLVEYEIIDTCVNSSVLVRNTSRQVDKIRVCACALDKTMEEISYKELDKSESEFLTRFRESISACY